MKPFHAIKSALVTGLLIVLPAWLAILLFLKVLAKLGMIVRPISSHLPAGVNDPKLIALAAFVLFCLIVGLLVHTAIGRVVGHTIESNILKHVPGYASLRAIAAQVGNFESDQNFQPVLIDIEDGCQAPAFLIEQHADGRCTVFLPSVPTPMAGAIFIMPGDRVHPVEVSVATMMKCISKWGTGSGEIIAAVK